MTNVVAFTRALADPTRWRIVRLVMEEALCVCELADILEMPQSSVSSHVQVIRKAGLLESEKCEKWTYFRIEAKYLKLLGTIEKFFFESGDSAWRQDSEKAVARLQERVGSCCPGPQKLKTRPGTQPKTATAR
jgi:ArsR family transcriptional regulator